MMQQSGPARCRYPGHDALGMDSERQAQAAAHLQICLDTGIGGHYDNQGADAA